MRVAIYVEAGGICTLHTKVVLAAALRSLGHSVECFISPNPGTMGPSRVHLERAGLESSFTSSRPPNVNDFDLLLTTNVAAKTGLRLKAKLTSEFLGNKKPVVCMRDTSCQDFWHSGYESHPLFAVTFCKDAIHMYRAFNGINVKNIIDLPPLSSYRFPKSGDPASREEFCSRYGIPSEGRILAFLPDGEHGHPSMVCSNWQHKTLQELSDRLREHGVYVVAKLHPYEEFGHKSGYYGGVPSSQHFFPRVPTVKEHDAWELVKYSSASLSSLTSFAFESMMYDLPHLSIGMKEDYVLDLFWKNAFNKEEFFARGMSDLSGIVHGSIMRFEDYSRDPVGQTIAFMDGNTHIRRPDASQIYSKMWDCTIQEYAAALIDGTQSLVSV